jgi:CDGSH-type Zn-finger protein
VIFRPIKINLKAGDYWWCTCGKNPSSPFCDINNKKKYCKPKLLKIKKESTMVLCTCSLTRDEPFCDGGHRKING